ncbi:MAG: beta-hydroxyacyl-ACP dehydratase [Gemmatales bacterium]|nr:beta-hydroxyacyl-ACP dehydratase [Gemmatales bacterium]MDW8386356.1 3-hydroxyacyl-ACP dehydratase FabZ family protein [Gemmatales bacterium]
MRWMWIDRFLEFTSRKSAKAVKNLSRAEDVFRDHFPGWPVMPASLILEGLAQTGGILVGEANDFREKVVLAKINKARFHREALAGEQLTYSVELLDLRPEGATISGMVHSGNDLVAEAEIMFAHLDQSRSQQVFGEQNFVFSGDLRKLLGLAKLLKS